MKEMKPGCHFTSIAPAVLLFGVHPLGCRVALLILVGIGFVGAGCALTGPHAAKNSEPLAEQPARQTNAPAQSAVRLWAQNCSSCHSLREPGAYTDAQWEVVMLHMRVRANLTTREHKAVLEFLRSAN